MKIKQYIDIRQEYYDLRLDTALILSEDEIKAVKELYRTFDEGNMTIAIQIMKTRLKEYNKKKK